MCLCALLFQAMGTCIDKVSDSNLICKSAKSFCFEWTWPGQNGFFDGGRNISYPRHFLNRLSQLTGSKGSPQR